MEAHPLFERVGDEELEVDVAAGLLVEGTEEGQKVARNKGKTWRHVFRRVLGPLERAAAEEGGGVSLVERTQTGDRRGLRLSNC